MLLSITCCSHTVQLATVCCTPHQLAGLRDHSIGDGVCVNGDVTYTCVVEWSIFLLHWLCLQTVQHFPAVDHSVQAHVNKYQLSQIDPWDQLPLAHRGRSELSTAWPRSLVECRLLWVLLTWFNRRWMSPACPANDRQAWKHDDS